MGAAAAIHPCAGCAYANSDELPVGPLCDHASVADLGNREGGHAIPELDYMTDAERREHFTQAFQIRSFFDSQCMKAWAPEECAGFEPPLVTEPNRPAEPQPDSASDD